MTTTGAIKRTRGIILKRPRAKAKLARVKALSRQAASRHAAERPLRRISFSGPVQPPSCIFGQSTGLGRRFRPSNSAAHSSTHCRDVETTGLGECRYPAVWHPAIRTRPVLPGLGLSRDSKHNHPLCRICHLAALIIFFCRRARKPVTSFLYIIPSPCRESPTKIFTLGSAG